MTISRQILAEASIMIALATSLDFISQLLPSLPQGGSIPFGAMVPIILFSVRHGYKYGIFCGFIFSIVSHVFSPPYIVTPIQYLLDYPIAFAALGLAGLPQIKNNVFSSVFVALFGRFSAHFISGIVWFGEYAPEGTPVPLYSAIYNGSYMFVELIITLSIMYILWDRDVLKINLKN